MADDLNIRYPGVALKNTLGIPIREKSLTSEPYIFFQSSATGIWTSVRQYWKIEDRTWVVEFIEDSAKERRVFNPLFKIIF